MADQARQTPLCERILLKPVEAAELLGVHVNTLYRWIAERGLPARKFAGTDNYYIPRLALEKWANGDVLGKAPGRKAA